MYALCPSPGHTMWLRCLLVGTPLLPQALSHAGSLQLDPAHEEIVCVFLLCKHQVSREAEPCPVEALGMATAEMALR